MFIMVAVIVRLEIGLCSGDGGRRSLVGRKGRLSIHRTLMDLRSSAGPKMTQLSSVLSVLRVKETLAASRSEVAMALRRAEGE